MVTGPKIITWLMQIVQISSETGPGTYKEESYGRRLELCPEIVWVMAHSYKPMVPPVNFTVVRALNSQTYLHYLPASFRGHVENM